MLPESRTVDLAPLDIRAAVKSADADARTVELTFSAGGRVERYDWMRGERYIEELSLDEGHVRLERLNSGAPLLDTHSGYSVRSILGSVVEGTAQLVNKRDARATVRFSKRAEVEPIWQDVRDGVVKQVSVGYRVYKFEETRGGKDGALPVRRAVDWEPYEISLVPMAADAGAKVRSEQGVNACLIVRADEKEPAMSEPTKTADQPATTTPTTESRAAVTPADDAAVREAAVTAERARGIEIRKAVKAAKLDGAIADDLIGRGVTLDAARAEILNKLADAEAAQPETRSGRVEFGEDRRDKWIRGAQAALLQRSGLAPLIAKHENIKVDTIDPGEFRCLTLIDLAREALAHYGVNVRGMDKMAIAGQAFTYRSNYQTTSDFATLLANTMHKVLRAAYGVTPDTWSRFCGTATVSDFRTHNWYRLGALTGLDDLNEVGEFKNKSIPDAETATFAATTKGNIIAVSRQVIVNDDLGAMLRLTEMLGRAGKLTIEKAVYTKLALNSGLGPTQSDSQPLFHSNRSNVGTGAALAAAAHDADRVVMAQQLDPNGQDYTDLRPAILLVPVGLGGQARVINQSQYDPDTVANKSQMKPNVVAGLFRDIVDTPRLSGTRRYLFADPSLAPVFMVSFLEGQQEPVLETQDGWRVDGVEMKARLDFGVDVVDYRGAVTNAGA